MSNPSPRGPLNAGQPRPSLRPEHAKVYVLGIGVSAINVQIALDTIDTWIRERDPNYVCVTGVHGVMESQEDKGLLQIHNNAGLVTPDGMPLVWIARARGHRKVERVYGPDLLLAVCGRSSPRKHKHFFYGGAAGVPELLAESLQKRFPGLQSVGTYSPPFRPLLPQEDAAIVEQIDRSGADIVWVGFEYSEAGTLDGRACWSRKSAGTHRRRGGI